MQISGDNIKFITNSKFFPKEKDGRKPNTTQIISGDIFDEFRDAFKGLKTITIVDNVTGEQFTRTLTDISEHYLNVKMCGLRSCVDFFIFSWNTTINIESE